MHHLRSITLPRILKLLVCVLICRVTAGVFLSYRDYMPPNFESDFLQGRGHCQRGNGVTNRLCFDTGCVGLRKTPRSTC